MWWWGGCSKCTLSSCRPQRCSALSCFIFSPKLPVLLLLSPSTPVREHVPSPHLEMFSLNCARPSRDHPFSSPTRASSSEEYLPRAVFSRPCTLISARYCHLLKPHHDFKKPPPKSLRGPISRPIFFSHRVGWSLLFEILSSLARNTR